MNYYKILNKFLSEISFLKVAGINKFVFVECYSSQIKIIALKRVGNIFSVKKHLNFHTCTVLASEVITGSYSFSDLPSIIEKFCGRNNLFNSYLVIGINEYKCKSISLPIDVDDIPSWFVEKTNIILPENCSQSDFSFSYEQYFQDEQYKYFLIAIVRSDLIRKIQEVSLLQNIHLLNIFPFPLALFSTNIPPDRNFLFVDFTENKINYSLFNTPSVITSGEIYLPNTRDTYDNLTLQNSITDFHMALLANVGEKRLNDLNLIICCTNNQHDLIINCFQNIFKQSVANFIPSKFDSFFYGSILAYNKILSDYNSQINLISEEILKKERFLLEKSISMRFILIGGLVILFLLLFCSISENLINFWGNQEQDNIWATNTINAQYDNIKKEGNKLEANLLLLHSLKDKRIQFSSLFLTLSKIISHNSYLISLDSKSLDMNLISLEIVGYSSSQREIAAIISNMENSRCFNEVTLLYSTERDKEENANTLFNSFPLKFCVVAKYDLSK